MVRNVTNFGRSGLYDWIIQRVSAVILGIYLLVMVGYLCSGSDLTFDDWQVFMSGTFMRIFSLLALVALAGHAWVGMWTIATDYIKATGVRIVFQLAVIIAIFVYLVWGAQILWGV